MLLLLRSLLKRCRRFLSAMAVDGRAPVKPHHLRTQKWDPHVALVLLLPTPSAFVPAIATDEARPSDQPWRSLRRGRKRKD
uniref:Uncharacterized protein n=1 Tax=Arundo donax TaxID=35708 RepID=A0A0A8ZNA3_ARUDO